MNVIVAPVSPCRSNQVCAYMSTVSNARKLVSHAYTFILVVYIVSHDKQAHIAGLTSFVQEHLFVHAGA